MQVHYTYGGVEAYATTEENTKILKAVRDAVVNLTPATAHSISKRTGMSDGRVRGLAIAMHYHGTLEVKDLGGIVREIYYMTPKGWAEVGGKPIWM